MCVFPLAQKGCPQLAQWRRGSGKKGGEYEKTVQSDKLNYEIHSLGKAVCKSDKKSATRKVSESERERSRGSGSGVRQRG